MAGHLLTAVTSVGELPQEVTGEDDVSPAQRCCVGKKRIGDVLNGAAQVFDHAAHIQGVQQTKQVLSDTR